MADILIRQGRQSTYFNALQIGLLILKDKSHYSNLYIKSNAIKNKENFLYSSVKIFIPFFMKNIIFFSALITSHRRTVI